MKHPLATALAAAVILALGLMAPFEPATAQDAKPDGKALFMGASCNMCHSVPSQGIAAKATSEKMKGPDIAGIASAPEQLAKYLRKQAQKNGADHMKEFKGTDEELKALVAWILSQK